MDTVFDMDEVAEPVFKVKFKGETRSYNAWDLAKKLQFNVGANGITGGPPVVGAEGATDGGKLYADMTIDQQVDAIREALGYPKVGTKDAINGGDLPTLSTQQCLVVMMKYVEFIQEIPEVKKLSALMQK